MKRRPSLPVLIAGVLAAALVATGLAAAALVLFFPAERVGALAAERASQALERDVAVDRIRLRLFPLPAVALEGVRVARWRHSQLTPERAAADTVTPLAEIARVDIRPKLLPLLRGAVVVDAIIIDQPRFSIWIEGDAEPTLETAEERAPGFWSDATFQIRRLEVRDGVLEYHDTRDGTTFRLEGLQQRVRLDGEMQGAELAVLRLAGRLEVERLDAELPERLAVPIRGARVALEHDAALDLARERLSLDTLALTLQEFTLRGSGTVDAWSDPAARELSLTFETGEADVAALVASLPAAWRSWPRGSAPDQELRAAGGRVSVRAAVEGRLGNGELPRVDGTASLRDVALSRGGESVLTELTGQLAFSLDSLVTSGLSARLLGEPLRVSFAARELAMPVIDASLSTTVNLGRATQVGLLPAGWTGRGSVTLSLEATGRALEPAELDVHGAVGLGGVALEHPEWVAPLTITAGEVALAGQDLAVRGFQATIGRTDVTVDAALAHWLTLALGDSVPLPQLVFDARSTLLDADELFPPDPDEPTYSELFFARLTDREIRGVSAAEAAREAGLRLPELPAMTLDGQVRLDRVLQRGAEYRDVDIRLAGNDGQLEIRDASFQAMGGGIHIAGRLGAGSRIREGDSQTRSAPLRLEYRVQDVGAETFLHRFTVFRGRLDGSLLLEGSLDAELDQNLLPRPESLNGVGRIAVSDARLVNWPLVRGLASELGLPALDTLAVRDWTGRFTMVGSRILLQETELRAGDLVASASGWFDPAGRLDLGATLYLGPSWTSRLPGNIAASLTAAAATEDGRVPIGVRITGTTTQPSLALDLSEAGRRMAERVREEATEQARDLARQLAEDLAERLGAGGVGAGVAPDSAAGGGGIGGAGGLDAARDRVRDVVADRLRGIFGAPRPQPQAGDQQEAAPEADETEPPADLPADRPADSAAPGAGDAETEADAEAGANAPGP